VPVRVRSTSTRPPLLFPFTDPALDLGLSLQLGSVYAYEQGQTSVVEKLLGEGRCLDGGGRRRLVLDVGAGLGWYSAFAAASGCRCGAQWSCGQGAASLHSPASVPA
jgi:hypothetical protein